MNSPIFVGIQVRLNSKRFPKKSFHPILGVPLIIRVLDRLQKIQHNIQLVLLTPKSETEVFSNFLKEFNYNIPIYGGSEENVLSRYYHACIEYNKPSLIMRVTADNPLLCIPLADMLIDYHIKHKCDLSHYMRNPLGTGVEIFSFQALEKAFENATESNYLEHVTQFMYHNSHLFHIEEPISPFIMDQYSSLSIDYPEDIKLISSLLSQDPEWDISRYCSNT